MGSKDFKPKAEIPKGAARKLPAGVTAKALGPDQARAAATAALYEAAMQFKEVGVDLGGLMGGEVLDLLNEGLGGNKKDRPAIGQERKPDGEMNDFDDPLGGLGGYLPPHQHHRAAAGLGTPSADQIHRGLTSMGGTEPGDPEIVPGSSGGTIKETGLTTYATTTDGTTTTKSTLSNGAEWRVIVSQRDANGNEKTTTVIGDGTHSAVITDHTDPSTSSGYTSHAEGDMDVIYREFDRRLRDEAGRGRVRSVDPDAPTGGSYYHPLTGQYWGPERHHDMNKVNPGPDSTSSNPTGPQVKIDPRILVINPNPVELPGGAGRARDIREGNPNQVDPPPTPE